MRVKTGLRAKARLVWLRDPKPTHQPLITSPTPRRKVKGAPLLASNTFPFDLRRPTYFIATLQGGGKGK